MLTMPLFFYSTTLVWVDDDGFFVKVVAGAFRQDYRVKIFLSPNSFLKFFEEYHATTDNLSFLQRNNGADDYDVYHRLPVDIDFQTIIDLYHNKGRINDISAIIVDFKMPKLTGLELMKQILPSAIKRILLTGEAENELAIAAFNDNIIDRFVHKGDASFAADLRLYVKQMAMQYFCALTKPLLAHLEVEHRLPQSDPVFIDFFDKWACLNNIVEYFVFDKSGSMLVADQKGQKIYFIIHTEQTLDEFSELHASDKAVTFFVNAVIQRYKIPFFGLFREAWEVESTQWTNHFYSPEVLQGRERYYWKAIAE